MYDNLIKWLVEIFSDPNHDLEPVEGAWGTIYAGTLDRNTSFLAFPDFEINYSLSTGLLEGGYFNVPGLGKVFALKWATKDSDMALPFIYDLVQSANLFTNPLEVFENKEVVWRDFNDIDHFSKFFRKAIGLWGEMKFVTEYDSVSKYWKGPIGTDADIVSNSVVLELKTTAKKTFESVSISSLWQLDDSKRDIFVILMSIENHGNAGESLFDLQEKVKRLEIDKRVLTKIESEMDSYGDILCESKFIMRDLRIYPVNDNFPFLTRRRLSACLPQETLDRITKLNYTISVNGLERVSERYLISKF